MPRAAIVRAAAIGFALMVSMVLLAAYVGYRGSGRIQDTAQTLIREQLVRSARGAEVESLIVEETQELVDELRWVLGLCIVLAFGTAGLTVWLIQRAFARLEWQAEELARVSWSMVDSHEKMAQRFSHEMHDELGQSLSGLRRMLGSLGEANVAARRQECMSIVDEVLQTVRKLSQVLRPVILDDFGLDSGLKWLCERFTQRMGIPVEYTSNFDQRLAEPLETHLFRITQEALTNVARHSGATQASVSLRAAGLMLRLEVLDNGVGLPASALAGAPSIGMVGMRARARQIGGELIVENRKSGGVRICVTAPVQEPQPGYEREQQQQEDPDFTG